MNKKDRALVAQMAAQCAAGLSNVSFFHNGRNMNVGLVAETSLDIAKAILAKLDAELDAEKPEK